SQRAESQPAEPQRAEPPARLDPLRETEPPVLAAPVPPPTAGRAQSLQTRKTAEVQAEEEIITVSPTAAAPLVNRRARDEQAAFAAPSWQPIDRAAAERVLGGRLVTVPGLDVLRIAVLATGDAPLVRTEQRLEPGIVLELVQQRLDSLGGADGVVARGGIELDSLPLIGRRLVTPNVLAPRESREALRAGVVTRHADAAAEAEPDSMLRQAEALAQAAFGATMASAAQAAIRVGPFLIVGRAPIMADSLRALLERSR
ncbi:MAG: hypothetical protein ACRELD_15390, partial [Longimicrobiales bacterium]